MGIEDGTCEFALTRPLEYSRNGTTEKALHVVLREPGMDHVKHYLKLKQMLMRAQMELAKQAGEINQLRDSIGEEVKPITDNADEMEAQADEMAGAIALALQAAGSVDIGEFIDTFEVMACMKARKPLVLVDGIQAMTSALWANLKPDDAFNMAARWLSFFVTRFEAGEQTTSGPQSESPTGRTVA